MKRILFSMLLGLVLGGGAVWFALHWQGSQEASKAAGPETAEAKDPLHLEPEAQSRAGIVVQPLAETNVAVEIRGYARVIEAAPLVQLVNELELARVARDASRKEWERLKNLFGQGQNASARALEIGEAAMKRDEALVNGAEARMRATAGSALVRRPELGGLMSRLARLDAALVRVELPAGSAMEGGPRTAFVASLNDPSHRTPVEWLGPAPSTDPLTQGLAFLALVSTNGFVPGTALEAFLGSPTDGRRGVVVPATAVVRHAGETFVFVAGDAGHFVRTPVHLEQPLTGGWLVTGGVTNHQPVVVAGAQVLLSNELQAQGGGE